MNKKVVIIKDLEGCDGVAYMVNSDVTEKEVYSYLDEQETYFSEHEDEIETMYTEFVLENFKRKFDAVEIDMINIIF